MVPPFVLYIASKFAFSSWRSTLASVLGIAASVLLLIVISSFANGLDEFLVDRFLVASPHIMVEEGEGSFIQDYELIESELDSIDGIVATSSYLTGNGILSYNDTSSNVMIKGVDWGKETLVTGIGSYLDEGEFQGAGAVIGSALARDIRAKVGDEVTLLSYSGNKSKIVVKGIFSTGYYSHDSTLVYINLNLAQSLLEAPGVTGIGAKLKDPAKASLMAERIQGRVKMWVRTWYEKNPSLLISLALERRVMLSIVFFTFVVAGFGVANLLYIQVLHKKESIGMLKALGVSNGSLQRIFLMQGAILGSLGGLLGWLFSFLVISVLIRYPVRIPEIYYTGCIPITIKARDFFFALVVAVVSTSIASVIPAFKAGRLSPMESLRRN
jgi:lipoprotein-releasing system permease protein